MARKQKICIMCKKPFIAYSYRQNFCGRECAQRHRVLQQRILRIFWGDKSEAEKQLSRFNELGKSYTFPSPHEQLNSFYQLGDEAK